MNKLIKTDLISQIMVCVSSCYFLISFVIEDEFNLLLWSVLNPTTAFIHFWMYVTLTFCELIMALTGLYHENLGRGSPPYPQTNVELVLVGMAIRAYMAIKCNTKILFLISIAQLSHCPLYLSQPTTNQPLTELNQ